MAANFSFEIDWLHEPSMFMGKKLIAGDDDD